MTICEREQKLIDDIRLQVARISKTAGRDLLGIVLENREPIFKKFYELGELVRPKIEKGFGEVQATSVAQGLSSIQIALAAMFSYADVMQTRADLKSDTLASIVAEHAPVVREWLDKIEQVLKLKQPPNPKAGG